MASNLRTIMQKRLTALQHTYAKIKNDELTSRDVKRDIFNRMHELESIMHEAYG